MPDARQSACCGCLFPGIIIHWKYNENIFQKSLSPKVSEVCLWFIKHLILMHLANLRLTVIINQMSNAETFFRKVLKMAPCKNCSLYLSYLYTFFLMWYGIKSRGVFLGDFPPFAGEASCQYRNDALSLGDKRVLESWHLVHFLQCSASKLMSHCTIVFTVIRPKYRMNGIYSIFPWKTTTGFASSSSLLYSIRKK